MRATLAAMIVAVVLPVHAVAADQREAASSVRLLASGDLSGYVTSNVSYAVVDGFVPGLPQDERLIVEQRISIEQWFDEKGAAAASVSAQAWRIGELSATPLWTIEAAGVGAEVALSDFYVVHAESTDWPFPPMTAYALASGAPVFMTTVPWARFYTTEGGPAARYAGFASVGYRPVTDVIGTAPANIGLITYASNREALQQVAIVAESEELAHQLLAIEEVVALSWLDPATAPIVAFDTVDVAADAAAVLRLDFLTGGLHVAIPLGQDRLMVEKSELSPGLIAIEGP